jgi:hypothetical protein
VSASKKIKFSPFASITPLFRALEIWFIGSNTTLTPLSFAINAVLSEELLSTTIISPLN